MADTGHEDGRAPSESLSRLGATYLRFIAMIVTGMAFMYAVTYLNTFEVSHVRWSEERLFMTLLMGATMAVVMLAFMLPMYRNWKANVAIVAGAALLFAGGLFLVRDQRTVEDRAYMSSMTRTTRLQS